MFTRRASLFNVLNIVELGTMSSDFRFQGTGKMRAVLVGNSHASLSFRSFARAFERHFDTLQLVGAAGRGDLILTPN